MLQKSILIVEDDEMQLQRYCDLALLAGYTVHHARDLDEARDQLDRVNIDVLLTDIHLSSLPQQSSYEGYELLSYVRDNCPETTAIIMSFDPRIETFNKALELGAANYIKKPLINEHELTIAVSYAKERRQYHDLTKKIDAANKGTGLKVGCKDGIVISDKVRNDALCVARSREFTCVITGETGTGKEELAKLIHRRRVEKEGSIPFVAVNCANIEPNLAVSQLFGHRKGSFTGADQASIGYVGEADGGVLFLDEIHHLSMECQRKLLRVLHDGSYQRLGDTKTLYAKFQLIVASTMDLDDLVERGKFMVDLRSRMIGIDIHLPPLRERLNDLDPLVKMIFAKENAPVTASELSKIVTLCKSYYWQGNIRQLYKVLKTMIMRASIEEKPILADDLPVTKNMYAPGEETGTVDSTANSTSLQQAIELLKVSTTQDVPFKKTIEGVEKALILAAIERHKTLADAASGLELARSTFDMKKKQYGLA